MKDLEITNIQKLYLLHLLNEKKDNNITSVAKAFGCSKPNSKNILDNMIIEGFLYKEGNQYHMTKIGKDLAEDLEEKRKEIRLFLQSVLKLDPEDSKNTSYKLIGSGMIHFNKILAKKSRLLNRFNKNSNIQPSEIVRIFGEGDYPAYLTIKKKKEDNKDQVIENSMASFGFERNARLIIGKESNVVLDIRAIKKPLGGYAKTGIVRELSYMNRGEEKIFVYDKKKFYLPLEIFKNWNLIGEHFLQCSIQLFTNSKIGFGSGHRKEAIFTISLDLINID